MELGRGCGKGRVRVGKCLFWYQLTWVVLDNKHTFNGPLSRTTQVSRYQIGKTNLDFTEARDSGWQWHQQGHMQVCTLLQTVVTPEPQYSVFLQAGGRSCHPTNSIKALEAG